VRTILSLALALGTLALGCNTAKLTPAADSGVDCFDPIPESPCRALDAGEPGCTGDLPSLPAFGRAVTVTEAYPTGCTLIVDDPVPDEDNQCITLGTCRCAAGDGGGYAWTCFK
jgi:hypothetical protein